MQTQPTTPADPRTEASRLVNLYASKTATLNAATADVRAELAALTASLNKIEAPHRTELDKIEAEAKALALAHGEKIFAGTRTLTENGYTLAIRETAAVQVEDEESAIRMISRDAQSAMMNGRLHRDTEIALRACLRVSTTLDREYISRHYDEAPEWFQQYGISVLDKLSASLKQAPKPRARKAAVLKPSEQPQQEAAA